MEVVQEILTRVSLAAAGGLIFACFVLRYGVAVLRLTERALRGFAALPFAAKVVLPAFLGVAILYGGSKTNAPPAQLLRSLPRMVPVRWRFADDTVTQRVRFDNWHRRGAVNDWRRVKFADGWVFPSGTNRLSSAMVMSRGEIRPRLQNTNAIARLSERLTMRPGEAEFFAEQTASNTYRFAWENCRDATNALKSAVVELFRNGDIRVTEQDGVRFLPRQIPFPHDGFGQDADWVRANFTNAEEILSVGYPNWVDSQVGVGLENGLYKLTATFPADPQEATLLKVGDYRVCVTNAGEYVFLLEKGPEYGLAIEPFNDQVTYSMQDDVCMNIPLLMSWWNDWGFLGKWTTDGDWEWLYRPELTDGVLWPGSCCWLPAFFGSPDCAYVGPGGGPTVFTANFRDYRYAEEVHYQWECSDPDVIIVSPNAAETEIRFRTMPSWRSTDISVTATTSNHVYFSELQEFVYGTNSTPQVHLSLAVPQAILLNSNQVDKAKLVPLRLSFSSDVPTNGIVRLSCITGDCRVATWETTNGMSAVTVGRTWDVVDSPIDFTAYVEGVKTSAELNDVQFKAEFVHDEDVAVERVAKTTVVQVGNVSLPGAPQDGLVIMRGTSVALQVDCLPSDAASLLSTLWQVRRLKGDGTYEDWNFAVGNYSGNAAVYTPPDGGIYQVRVLAGVAGGGTDARHYEWAENEDSSYGFKRKGDAKAFGVASYSWQLDLREVAKVYLGSESYLTIADIPSLWGYPALPPGAYKCNIFVAHRIVEAGLATLKTRGLFNNYPPLANDWGGNASLVPGWIIISNDEFPEPGYIVADPADSDEEHGHVGIVDFDGQAISAGATAVNRIFDAFGVHRVFRRIKGSDSNNEN